MSYRGDDLDLRTPRGWSAPSEGAQGEGEDAASGPIERYAPARRPIWVDETVLACCNHAFDVAAANGAAEVGLEHLLHAMTRVESAAEVLEARSVRVFGLRRETEAAIANDSSTAERRGPANPRRSDEFEDVLRRAAAQAYRHGMSPSGDPASIDDILDVLSDVRLDLPGLALFARHAERGGREPAFRRAFSLTSEPMSHGRFPRERGRQSPAAYGHDAYVPAPRRDAVVDHVDAARGVDPAALLKIADRLQALEHALTELKAGAASQTGAVEKAAGRIERSLESRSAEISAGWKAIAERLNAMGGAVGGKESLSVALTPIDDRLAIIEEAVLGFEPGSGQRPDLRIDALREAVESHRGRSVAAYTSIETEMKAVSGALARLGGLGAALDAHHKALAATFDGKMSRMGAEISQLMAAMPDAAGPLGEKWSALLSETGTRQETRLASTETAILGTLRMLEARQKGVAGAIEQYGKANGECLDHIDGRLMRLESGSSRAMALIEDMHRLTFERHHWRRRFWRWLLGTNDWMAASWPSEVARVDAEIEGRASP